MRNKKRMLAAGLITVALLSTVNGCGSTTGNMQDTQSIQGTTGAAGGTVQGSGSTGTASDTASQNNSNTADHNAQDNSSGTGIAQNGSNTTDHTAQTGNNDSSETSQTAPGGVSIETAKQTVMDRIPGIDAGNIYIHPDYDDGISLYEGEAYYAEVKYEFEINAENGNIISWEAESIYD